MPQSLDPKDWSSLEKIGKEMVGDMMNYLEKIDEQPVWKNAPEDIKNFFKQSVPHQGIGEEKTYAAFKDKILPYSLLLSHPRYWGWVNGTGFPFAMLSDMLASGINTLGGFFNQTGNFVEIQVIDWFKNIMGYPKTASGLMVSGGSMANFVGLNVARDTKASELGINIRKEGLCSLPKQLIFYCSKETHSCVDRTMQMLGMGTSSLRKINTNENYQIDLSHLEDQIKKDLADDLSPACVIAAIGTTGTRSIDDINGVADICKKYNRWFHIDGTFGSLVAISKTHKHLVTGIERSDSLSFDLHKWMYIPYEAACVLVKNKEAHFKTYNLRHDYISSFDDGIASGEWMFDYGPQMSRRFNALKVWMSISAFAN